MTTLFVFQLFIVFMIVSALWTKLRYGAPPPGITDRELAALARAGKHKQALRWYRLRYGVGHGAAKRGLSRLLQNE
jgi:hypothetical protein